MTISDPNITVTILILHFLTLPIYCSSRLFFTRDSSALSLISSKEYSLISCPFSYTVTNKSWDKNVTILQLPFNG